MRSLLLGLVAFVLFVPKGFAAVIDFESLATAGQFLTNTYTEDGFLLDTPTNFLGYKFVVTNSDDQGYQGSTAIGAGTIQSITLTKIDGSPFTLSSMDFTGAGVLGQSTTPTFTVTGSILGDGTVTQQITIDQLSGFQTFTFTGFTNLTQVSWDFAWNQVDNIVLDPGTSICDSRTTGLDRAGCSAGENGSKGREIASGRVVNPEPTTWLLFGTGLGALGLLKRRQMKRGL